MSLLRAQERRLESQGKRTVTFRKQQPGETRVDFDECGDGAGGFVNAYVY